MEAIITKGQLVFGIALVALGVENLFCAHFGLKLNGVPWVPVHSFLCYMAGAALIAAGVSIAANVRCRLMATLLGYLFLGFVLFRALPLVLANPADWSVYGVLFEALAFGGLAWTLAQTLPQPGSRWESALSKVTVSGPYLFAISLIVFGGIHFLVARFIASVIPAWIPGSFSGPIWRERLSLLRESVSLFGAWISGRGFCSESCSSCGLCFCIRQELRQISAMRTSGPVH